MSTIATMAFATCACVFAAMGSHAATVPQTAAVLRALQSQNSLERVACVVRRVCGPQRVCGPHGCVTRNVCASRRVCN